MNIKDMTDLEYTDFVKKNVTELIKGRGISFKQAGLEMGLDRRIFSIREYNFSLNSIRKICVYFGVDSDDILGF